METFLREATDVRRLDVARSLLEAAPGDFVVALLTGDVDAVCAALAGDPKAASRPVRGRPPLVWVTHSAFLADPAYEDDLVACARVLLRAGADPDAARIDPEFGALSALYGAAGVAHSAAMTSLLLEAGANPDDDESLYHCCETRDHTILRLLLGAGARVEGTNALAHMLDYEDAVGLRLLLAAAEAQGGTSLDGLLRHALIRDRSRSVVEVLLAAGAVAGPGDAELAVRRGREDLRELLGGGSPSPADELLGALRRADRAAVDAVLAGSPGLLGALGRGDHDVLVHAASLARADAVRLMLDLGFPVDVRSEEFNETALHAVCWYGRADMAELLIGAGADPHAEAGPPFGGTPLDWALRGSRYSELNVVGAPDGIDHAAVVRLLVEAGTRFTAAAASDATAPVAALLPA